MIPYFNISIFSLGPLTIHTWGFVVSIGFAVAIFVAYRRCQSLALSDSTKLSFYRGVIFDLAFWILVAAFIGARLFHVFFYEWAYYGEHLREIIRIDQGGLSSFGGFIGAAVAFLVYGRSKFRHPERSEGSRAHARTFVRDPSPPKADQDDNLLLRYADVLMFAWPLGHAIGRIGCFLTHMHPGRLSNIPWAVQYPGGARLDMGLIESTVLLSYWVIMLWSTRRKRFTGFYLVSGMIFYGAARFGLDFFRAADISMADARYFGLTPAQYGSIVLIMGGLYCWYALRRTFCAVTKK